MIISDKMHALSPPLKKYSNIQSETNIRSSAIPARNRRRCTLYCSLFSGGLK